MPQTVSQIVQRLNAFHDEEDARWLSTKPKGVRPVGDVYERPERPSDAAMAAAAERQVESLVHFRTTPTAKVLAAETGMRCELEMIRSAICRAGTPDSLPANARHSVWNAMDALQDHLNEMRRSIEMMEASRS